MEWTDERIAAFWEHCAENPAAESEYFTFQVGAGVVALLSEAVSLRGARVLDFGCGPGFLIQHLLQAGAIVVGADSSPHSVRMVADRYRDHRGWDGALTVRGGRASVGDGSFDGVCCIETIEHVPGKSQMAFLAEISRVLAPGGWALFTTPNEEDLSRSLVFCPACGETFHRVQHLTSWTVGSLSSLLSSCEMEVQFCRPLDLCRFQPPQRRPFRHWSLAYLYRTAERAMSRFGDRLWPRPFPHGRYFALRCAEGPHLVALAVKRAPR